MTTVFVLGVGLALTALFAWAFKTLPQEQSQFMGAVPGRKNPLEDSFDGVNFTWYGFFSALAYAAGAALFVFLMGSVGVPLIGAILAAVPVLLICATAANLLVRFVEGKRYGFTVGGASFVGLFVAPACLVALAEAASMLGFATPIPAGLAAMGIAYVLGEGIGRLACISFGCCYGKPVDQTEGWLVAPLQRTLPLRVCRRHQEDLLCRRTTGRSGCARPGDDGQPLCADRFGGPGAVFREAVRLGCRGRLGIVPDLARLLGNLSRRLSRRPAFHGLPMDGGIGRLSGSSRPRGPARRVRLAARLCGWGADRLEPLLAAVRSSGLDDRIPVRRAQHADEGLAAVFGSPRSRLIVRPAGAIQWTGGL